LYPESTTPTTSTSLTTDRSTGLSEIHGSLRPTINEPGYVAGNDSFSALRPINTDLYFLERYFSHICPTLSSRPETQRNWARRWTDSNGSPKQPHYLTHLQIAISELHFCLTETDTNIVSPQRRRSRLEDGVYHQNAAISILRPLLGSTVDMQTRGPEEITALFSAAWLLFLFNLTFPRNKHTNPNWILDEIVELSELSKGVVAIMIGASAGMAPPVKSSSSSSDIKQQLYADGDDDHTREAKARVMTGPLRAFFEPLLPWKHQDVPPSVRRQNLSASAQDLIRTIESFPQTTAIHNKPLYQLAIDELEMTTVAMQLHTQHPAFVFMWLVGTKRQFMELIKQRDDLALRILREYGLLLKTVDSHWWARGLGRTIVEGVDMALFTQR
jgi:hypothetical protein